MSSRGNCEFEFIFFASHPKNLKKFEKFGFFNFSDLFWMFTNGCRLWTIFLSRKIHFLDKIEKKAKFGDFLEIQKISCIRSLLVMTFFSFWPNLISYGSFITSDVKLPNFEKVYHGPVVLWRLCLLSILKIDDTCVALL